MNQLTDFEQGFLIGLIEGEGSIGLSGKPRYRSPKLVIANTDYDLLQYADALLKKLGVKTGLKAHNSPNSKKQCYNLYLYGHRSLVLLRPLLEQLVSKHRKDQFKLIISRLREMQNAHVRRTCRLEYIVEYLRHGKTTQQVADSLGLPKLVIESTLWQSGIRIKSLRSPLSGKWPRQTESSLGR